MPATPRPGSRPPSRAATSPAWSRYARRESPAKGSRLLGLAHALVEQPHTHAAMHAGVLSEWRAMLISRETSCLSREDRATVDAQISAPNPDGTYPFDGWGDRRLAAETQKAVIALDPQAVVNRRAKAEAERHVSMRPAPDTMARLSALLPAAQGIAVWATLTKIADQARSAGDPRTRGQVMADTLVERITGQTRADAVPVTVNVVISDQALLGDSHEPAWLQGYGPIPADTLDPEHDDRDPHASTRHRRPGHSSRWSPSPASSPPASPGSSSLRDQTCRTPYCDAPIRHHDHAEDHATGGPTTATNGQGLCEHCNHTKQAPGWTATTHQRPTRASATPSRPSSPPATPPDPPHPPTPTPAALRQISRAEIYLSRIVLAA